MNRLLKLIHIAERRWCKPARLRIKVILGVAAASAVSARAAVDSALPARPDAGIDLGPHLLPIVILGGFVTLGVGVVLWWQRRMFRQLAEQARRLRAQDEQLQGELATRLQTEAALRESQALVRRSNLLLQQTFAAAQERENMQAKMLESQKLESLGVLAGGIAHDFNNLLTVILANASFVRDTTEGNDARLEQIETAARRAADLCRQMLAYAGKGRLQVEPIDPGALIQDTMPLIQASVSKKARLHLNLADRLPLVDADASQLRQLLLSLVTNAAEALGDGSGEVRITTRLAQPDPAASVCHAFDVPPGDCVCIEVADTGHGMTPATLGRIFEPFFTTKFTGRGLGLAAGLGIVRTHRGALTVDSIPGHGSTFRLHLPVSRTATPSYALSVTPLATQDREGPGTVLIADDEPGVLEATSALLRHRGFKTVLAIDGNDAVRQFSAEPRRFAAVLLDLTMPGLGGVEALHAIRLVNESVPALVMSGFGEQEVFERVRGLGRVAILRKPFTQEMLFARMDEVAAS